MISVKHKRTKLQVRSAASKKGWRARKRMAQARAKENSK